ncbi:putative selenium-dependent hydroxylase accessory protein YqeC [Methylohalomonas lacus]|uniref:Selenium-dependent hydroxylase accessory protein YqeC n=1 Tax=Methylohalomonas lacus TaxID=398773 RepID=A0AAE3HNX0_9GAMM|nr:selenium cofactor biosynthesis protein YqeC [Methylohalomonas lacus]MCS3904247.1 putative selenium-dependent hydroxylase accessory protein YqeC [Methylohalomonas lacus]
MTNELLNIFRAEQGIVCCVGAGGKKTTMFRLAREHAGRVGLTTSAHIEYFPRNLSACCYVAEETELLQSLRDDNDSRVIAFATPSQRTGRHAGIAPERIDAFYRGGRFDLLLVKSDGARSRLIKAPNDNEPPLPEHADTVIPVVSARVIGRRLNEKIAHRPERIATISGAAIGDSLQPEHLARLLAAPEGALKNTGQASVVPLINMVDDTERTELARAAAEQALALTHRFDYVVLATMRAEQPIVDIVRR